VAGEAIAVRSDVVILGIKMPLSLLVMSNIADASGELPSELIAICAIVFSENRNTKLVMLIIFMILFIILDIRIAGNTEAKSVFLTIMNVL
jgi:hypothetical protein